MATYDELHDHVRGLVLAEVPDAEEGTSYGMPAWRVKGKPLLGLNRAKAHVGVYPFSPEVVDAVRGRLAGFTLTKGGVQCTPDRPVPDDVLVEMVRLRLAEIG
ncbi:DUF1801 domain-containing protein [Nocardioides sp. MAH-18]|uniref:DUF1801 domain-containing protein n=1 Tax=Nocardioides agri TaxID=2682843 RepID=A0A6L6XKS6_9ACTN|nr:MULTISPECIES: DUF1801 domain-containing protein [unclassified Nocardioides]MBA2953001.1 DUF1801 domain-containing protein [Nocardioides sp. CGMCC 1.13656]MVQ47871.1 DUF1801 domain-containing protein [Nocardioides sp. MAH-18]